MASQTTQSTFRCHDCGQHKPIQRNGGTGYGIYREDNTEHEVCYACCGEREKRHMEKNSSTTLYLVKRDGGWFATDWPGTLSFPARVFGRSATFTDHLGHEWTGRIRTSDQIFRCHRKA